MVETQPQKQQSKPINGVNGIHNHHHDEADFDPSAPPPFKIAEIRAAIPKHCWVKNPWRSLSYVFRDLFAISAMAAAAIYLDSWYLWPLYWAAQGTMFWALFVLGHDCGHGSFSDSRILNTLVGHILHSAILVPYNGWRISHRTHHQNHGHVENDESWVPLTEKLYSSLDESTRKFRFRVPYPIFAYPFYLWTRSPGKKGSHFNPYSDLFAPNERRDVIASTTCWTMMVSLLVYLSFVLGPLEILKLYGVPYWIFVMWLDMVTYLHHHGYDEKLPWYRGKEWSYLRGGLTTVDRDYGMFNNIHHDIGTHVIHHLFPQIPHYHLREATKAAKPVLGKYYRDPKKSGPFPVHLIDNLLSSMSNDHYVSDTGDIVFYQTDPKLFKSLKEKMVANVTGDQVDFDPSAPPPFKIAEIRDAIPKHCWVKNPWRSLSYAVWDVLVVFAMAAIAKYLDSWYAWPIYWVAQGTMFWAVFVIGHDCGHGSFSDSRLLNNFVGHILHSAILVPYHGWRISHRTHHQNHGNVEKDESWVPMTESLYKKLDNGTKTLRFTIPFPFLAYPVYLFYRSPGKEGSHFHPSSDLFSPNERFDIITSTASVVLAAALLLYFSIVQSPIQMLKLYFVPYWIFVMWLDIVTYLHHHGYKTKLPWYRGKEWSYLRGGLTTVDRDYGMFNKIHHDIGTHVIHHLFPQIPHYHLEEATKAAKPVLGKYYREPKKSGPIPFHLFKILATSIYEDNYVSDDGEIVFYQTDPQRLKASKNKAN